MVRYHDHDHPDRAEIEKYPDVQGEGAQLREYNKVEMLEQVMDIKNGFAHRLSVLRMAKGLSARELSLSMGMTANYINSIENGDNLPSMTMFFEICAALDVTPREFFDYSERRTEQKAELGKHIEKLSSDRLDLVLKLVKMIEK